MSNKKNNSNKTKHSSKGKFIILAILLITTVVSSAYLGLEYKKDLNNQKELKVKIEKEKKLEAERIKREMLNRKTAKKSAKDSYGVDAKIVSDALITGDYSNEGKKEVFLTFDDGPSTTNTPKVLDTLKANNVHATFFIMGKTLQMDGAAEILKRTYNEGHAIGNHTYSHDYSSLYPGRILNLNNFVADLDKNLDLMKQTLGKTFRTDIIRCPGGHMSWQQMKPLDDYLANNKMYSIDWNALNEDAEGKKKNASELLERAKINSQGKNLVVILMHDTYGKDETAKALDSIIKYYKSEGYEFKIIN